MPAHGIGTACFLIQQGGKEHIVRIHNCLLCHGEERFNLLSVSQVLRTRKNEVVFSADDSRLAIHDESADGTKKNFGLIEKEGLYEMHVSPLYVDDIRMGILPCVDLTLDDDPELWNTKRKEMSTMKAPVRGMALQSSVDVGKNGRTNAHST